MPLAAHGQWLTSAPPATHNATEGAPETLLLQAAWGDPEGRRPLVRAQAQAPLAPLTEAEALGNAVAAQLRAGGALGA